jgi:hypothetical protein
MPPSARIPPRCCPRTRAVAWSGGARDLSFASSLMCRYRRGLPEVKPQQAPGRGWRPFARSRRFPGPPHTGHTPASAPRRCARPGSGRTAMIIRWCMGVKRNGSWFKGDRTGGQDQEGRSGKTGKLDPARSRANANLLGRMRRWRPVPGVSPWSAVGGVGALRCRVRLMKGEERRLRRRGRLPRGALP